MFENKFGFYILAFYLLCFCGCRYADKTDIRLHKGFRGHFAVVYNIPGGEEATYVDGRLILNIPKDGVLIVNFERKKGILDTKVYTVDSLSILSLIVDDKVGAAPCKFSYYQRCLKLRDVGAIIYSLNDGNPLEISLDSFQNRVVDKVCSFL